MDALIPQTFLSKEGDLQMKTIGEVWSQSVRRLKGPRRFCGSGVYVFLLWFLAAMFCAVEAQTSLKYQEPPKAIVDLVDAKLTPFVDVSPGDGVSGRWLLIEQISGLPLITDLAQPELRLAGLRFNPRTNGPSRGRYVTALRLKGLPDGAERAIVGMPAEVKIRFAGWAPDARHIFFVNVSDAAGDAGLSLWIVDVAQARRVPDLPLNGVFGKPCEWVGTGSLICKAVPKGRGSAPVRSEVPTGPVVQENLGRVTPGPTFQFSRLMLSFGCL
jgi:hypothetical protein